VGEIATAVGLVLIWIFFVESDTRLKQWSKLKNRFRGNPTKKETPMGATSTHETPSHNTKPWKGFMQSLSTRRRKNKTKGVAFPLETISDDCQSPAAILSDKQTTSLSVEEV
jgi:hypothetical protein